MWGFKTNEFPLGILFTAHDRGVHEEKWRHEGKIQKGENLIINLTNLTWLWPESWGHCPGSLLEVEEEEAGAAAHHPQEVDLASCHCETDLIPQYSYMLESSYRTLKKLDVMIKAKSETWNLNPETWNFLTFPNFCCGRHYELFSTKIWFYPLSEQFWETWYKMILIFFLSSNKIFLQNLVAIICGYY